MRINTVVLPGDPITDSSETHILYLRGRGQNLLLPLLAGEARGVSKASRALKCHEAS